MRIVLENLDQIEDIVSDLVLHKHDYYDWEEFNDVTDFENLIKQLKEAEKNTQEYIESLEYETDSLNDYIEMEQEQIEYIERLDSMYGGDE